MGGAIAPGSAHGYDRGGISSPADDPTVVLGIADEATETRSGGCGGTDRGTDRGAPPGGSRPRDEPK